MFMLLIQEKFGPDTRKVFEKMEQAAQHPDIAGLKAVWKKLIVAADVRRLTSKSEIKIGASSPRLLQVEEKSALFPHRRLQLRLERFHDFRVCSIHFGVG
jgi:hypothetical protein